MISETYFKKNKSSYRLKSYYIYKSIIKPCYMDLRIKTGKYSWMKLFLFGLILVNLYINPQK